MELKHLDIKELQAQMHIVHEKLNHKIVGEPFLNEVFAEVPAIETLFRWMGEVARSKKCNTPKYKKMLAAMERDFIFLLALWEIEKMETSRLSDLSVQCN